MVTGIYYRAVLSAGFHKGHLQNSYSSLFFNSFISCQFFPAFIILGSLQWWGKMLNSNPGSHRHCPNAKLCVGQTAWLFEFPQHVAVLVLAPNAHTASMPTHYTHTSAGPDGMRISNQRHTDSFGWHWQSRENVDVILSQGELRGSEVPLGLKPGPKWKPLPRGKPVRSQLTDLEGEESRAEQSGEGYEAWISDLGRGERESVLLFGPVSILHVAGGIGPGFVSPLLLDFRLYGICGPEPSINERVTGPEARGCWQECCWQGLAI